MAFFVFAKVGKGWAKAGFRVMLKYFEIKSFIFSSLFRYYVKQIKSLLPCVCLVILEALRSDNGDGNGNARTLSRTGLATSCWRSRQN